MVLLEVHFEGFVELKAPAPIANVGSSRIKVSINPEDHNEYIASVNRFRVYNDIVNDESEEQNDIGDGFEDTDNDLSDTDNVEEVDDGETVDSVTNNGVEKITLTILRYPVQKPLRNVTLQINIIFK